MQIQDYTIVDAHGLVRSFGQTAEPQYLSTPQGWRVLVGVKPLDVNCWWDFAARCFYALPASPGRGFDLDPVAKVWRCVQTLQDLRDQKLAQVNDAFESASALLTEGYPTSERLTWPIQQGEALAWAATGAPTPYLDGLALARGIDAADLRAKTLANVQAWMAASQQLIGRRQQLRDLIADAQTVDAIAAISWEGGT
ncbi:hypothetical protein [Pseudacidovorax intermedius]|uniref:hypothetical protein n=1 Tax=Pseudacidovorax intermedius TaxID=433924 RepID=UPI0007347AC3|nr:hypothetical protein [Pseudacidovorax intermedius]